MSGRVCYLGRADRGNRLAHVRLVGPNTEDAWEAQGAADDPAAVATQIGEAAAWVAQRAMRGDGPRGEIAILCVDVEGSSCGWLTTPGSETSVVLAAMAHGEGEWSGGAAPASGAWAPPGTAEASVQALAADTWRAGRNGSKPGAGQKLAVLAVPDVSARLFIDALDDQGVYIERALSLWHAMALAWDPSGPIAGESLRAGGSVVATSGGVTAVVLIDPAGRLVWTWSSAGELLAAGAIRLAMERREGPPSVFIGSPEVGRLAADWLAWSVQLGRVPIRVVCIGPRTGSDDAGGGLTPAALGTALGTAWPGATVDLAVHDDPVGATLHRLAGLDEEAPPEDARRSLLDLSRRPGRAHRAVYRWAALSVLAGAIALGAVGWKAWRGAGAAAEARRDAQAQVTESVSRLMTDAGIRLNDLERETLKGRPRLVLEQQLDRKRTALNPNTGLDPVKPILPELDSLSYVLGTPEIEIDEISLLNSNALLYVAVPDTRTAEALAEALNANSHCEWRPPEFGGGRQVHPGKQMVTLFGKWKTEPAPGGRP